VPRPGGSSHHCHAEYVIEAMHSGVCSRVTQLLHLCSSSERLSAVALAASAHKRSLLPLLKTVLPGKTAPHACVGRGLEPCKHASGCSRRLLCSCVTGTRSCWAMQTHIRLVSATATAAALLPAHARLQWLTLAQGNARPRSTREPSPVPTLPYPTAHLEYSCSCCSTLTT
jgi:hypothetical protein